MLSVWYISKYFGMKTSNNRGGRDYQILSEMNKLDIDITVITSDSNNVVEVPSLTKNVTIMNSDGLKIVWLKTMKYQIAKSSRRILSWLHFEWNLFKLDKKQLAPPDAIIVSSLSLLTILNGLYLKKKFKCKLLFEIRDIWPLTITEEGGFSKKNPFVMLLSWVEKLGYKYSDSIIGTMPNLQEHVQATSKNGHKVHCIPMGVNDSMLNSATDLLPESYLNEYIPENKFIVTYAGTIGITNALDVLFKAAEILQSNENIHFLIVGDGALKKSYEEKYGFLKNITFAPKVKRDQVQSVLYHSHLLYFSVFPSKVWKYGQSLNKVIDYMLAEKPILASYDGFKSMINEANCGEFISANDPETLAVKISEYALLPPEKLLELGSNGKNWLKENRHYQLLAKNYLDIIKK